MAFFCWILWALSQTRGNFTISFTDILCLCFFDCSSERPSPVFALVLDCWLFNTESDYAHPFRLYKAEFGLKDQYFSISTELLDKIHDKRKRRKIYPSCHIFGCSSFMAEPKLPLKVNVGQIPYIFLHEKTFYIPFRRKYHIKLWNSSVYRSINWLALSATSQI